MRKLTNLVPTPPQWVTVNVDPQPADEKEPPLLVKIGSAVIEIKLGYNRALLSDAVQTLQSLC